MSSAPGLIEIEDAYHRIESFIHKTPVMTSSALNKISNENSGNFFYYCKQYSYLSTYPLAADTRGSAGAGFGFG